MALLTIPLTNSPNQSFNVTLPINNKNIKMLLEVRYKEICGYWLMTIKNPETKKSILENIPLLTGGANGKSANVLQQFQYLGIGSAFVVKMTETELDFPNDEGLGSDFVLVWGDDYDLLVNGAN